MNKKIILFILATFMVASLFAKSLEREANELGVQAETKYNNKEYTEAGKIFEQAIAKFNEAVKADGIPMDDAKVDRWLELAFNAYFNGKDFENAIRVLNVRAERNPSDYKIVNYQSIIYSKYLKQPLKAIEVLTKYNAQKRSFKVEKKIAGLYVKADDFENALKWYEKAYELRQDSGVIKNIAALNLKLNRKVEAVNAYEDFLQTNPKESVLIKTYRNMGKLYEDMDDNRNAIKYYEKSNNLKYQKTVSLLLVGKYYDMKNYDKAKSHIEKILADDPGNDDAIYYRALINYDTGNKAAAKADFQKIGTNPKYASTAKKFIESIDSE